MQMRSCGVAKDQCSDESKETEVRTVVCYTIAVQLRCMYMQMRSCGVVKDQGSDESKETEVRTVDCYIRLIYDRCICRCVVVV